MDICLSAFGYLTVHCTLLLTSCMLHRIIKDQTKAFFHLCSKLWVFLHYVRCSWPCMFRVFYPAISRSSALEYLPNTTASEISMTHILFSHAIPPEGNIVRGNTPHHSIRKALWATSYGCILSAQSYEQLHVTFTCRAFPNIFLRAVHLSVSVATRSL